MTDSKLQFKSVEPKSPSLDDIVTAYHRAVRSDDITLKGQAELAVQRLAAAEAAVAESATLVDFAARLQR